MAISMNQLKVLLCSDTPSYNQSLATAFEEESNSFRIVGTIILQELKEVALKVQPDIVIIKFDDMCILPSIVNLKNECPFILPIILVQDPNIFNLFDLINSGICGYLPLRLLPRHIVNAVELIALAGIMCLPRLSPKSFENREKEFSNLNALTSREREVLSFLGKSYSNQEIADSLCLSESTVKTHLHNVFKKLNVRNRTEAVALVAGSDLKN
ncbi:MAG: response regulator transcription factor [Syntrophomonas sp.]